MKKFKFMALSGADRIDANSYFLQLGLSNIILDSGSAGNAINFHGPNYSPLFRQGLIRSMEDISQVYVSHAHMDHIGYLPQLLVDTKSPAFMTSVTKLLTHYQVLDRFKSIGDDVGSRIAVANMLDKIRTVHYLDEQVFPDYKATFLQAGHLLGAMMTLFNYQGRNILYTGDYSFKHCMETHGFLLPEKLKIDTLIMCGTHAKHPWYERADNRLTAQVEAIYSRIRHNRNVFCRVNQLSKGIELLTALNCHKKLYNLKFPIYLDNNLMDLVAKLENERIPVLEENNLLLRNGKKPVPHITIAMGQGAEPEFDEEVFNVDFSLHDDFNQIKQFVNYINPKQIVVVHCGSKKNEDDETIEDSLMWDPDCTTSTRFIFPQEGFLYEL